MSTRKKIPLPRVDEGNLESVDDGLDVTGGDLAAGTWKN